MPRTGRSSLSLGRILSRLGRPFFDFLILLVKTGQKKISLPSFAVKSKKAKPKKKKSSQKNKKVRRQKRQKGLTKALRKLIKGVGWGLVGLGILAATIHFWLLKDLPRPNRLTERDHIVSTKIYDRHGQLLYKTYRSQNRTLVDLDQLPADLIQATVAIEDAEFWEHHGFSWRGILRSIIKNLKQGRLQGGSTITQQLVKNALLTSERTLTRKLKELILSIQVELLYTKPEIIQMYLNEVGYGGAAYGAQEAAWTYFGKPVNELNLAEAALLAGLPASPTRYSPFGAHPELAKQRQVLVLQRMADEGFISQLEAQETQAQEVQFNYQPNSIRAPHFVMYVKDQLVEMFGEQVVEEGGLEVYTSLDLEIQTMVEETLNEELAKIGHLNVNNGAVLVTEPQTGQVLAMVGSKDYFDLENDGNVNVTLQPRQPGSAIKPLTYALALENGYTAASLINDAPIAYQIPGQPDYIPTNYDNRFHGKVTLRQALACSYNIPAVKILSSLGTDQLVEFGQKMGLTTWNQPERYGLALTLGSAEVKLVDLAVAYGTFANLGNQQPLRPIIKVTDYKDRDYPLPTDETEKKPPTLNPGVAFLINDILADNQARTPTFGARSQLYLANQKVAVKTGTSNQLRDNWTIGYTPDLLVGVWVGNNDNTPMSRVASGVTGASPVWRKVTLNLLTTRPNSVWEKPVELTRLKICPQTNSLACSGCAIWEYFIAGTEPTRNCSPLPTAPRETTSSQEISLPTNPTPVPVPTEILRQRKNPPGQNR